MKKFLKIAGIIIGVLLIIILGSFIFLNASDIPKYEVALPEFQHTSSPEILVRGEKFASMLCAGCHADPQTGKFTGKLMSDAPPEFGTIYAQNITQDPAYGIGEWTDSELLYLLRTGIKRDGTYSPPYMAKLPKLADEDMNAIIAFLRSDDPRVQADSKPDQPCEPSVLTKFLSRTAFKPFPMPDGPIALPDTADMIALGKYLATNLECFSCHSADFVTNNFLNPELSEGYYGGGNKPLNMSGEVMLTPNLTPDPETGIGNWTEQQFIDAVKYGIKPGEPALQYPMQPYVKLSDYEAAAIYKYLRTIPAISNEVIRTPLRLESE